MARGERVGAVIAGAGSGSRLGAQLPKALVPIAGEPLVVHAIRSMNRSGITRIVVTIPQDADSQQLFAEALAAADVHAELVPGGLTRQESVARGLAHIDTPYVLIHDAARPFVPPAVVDRVVAALDAGYEAVVPALPVADTIKEIREAHALPIPEREEPSDQICEGDSAPVADALLPADKKKLLAPIAGGVSTEVEPVGRTLERQRLRAMQTPQGFRRDILEHAHRLERERSMDEAIAAPDDAALVEMAGGHVVLVAGAPEAMKVTTPWDLRIARMIAEEYAGGSPEGKTHVS
ncbi:2-C-methyl-D-erythritol 4-phosphate cytidylyltransferase [Trueperella sp. LYQ143]|uniref:IspD/TarI family cytidylyltransferase n=1 Tax=unclassified Trueperella TaxID=2630174 RepID=UPI003982F056